MQKILLLSLLLLLALFTMQWRYGRGGLADYHGLSRDIAQEQQTKDMLEVRNKNIQLKIDSLKGSPQLLEARARFELNVTKPNEILVQFINMPSQTTESAHGAPTYTK